MPMLFDNEPFNCDKFMEDEFLQLKEKYAIKNIIETGTYHGITTEFFCKNFDAVHTIELNETYFNVAKERLGKYENCRQYLGSSDELLAEILKQCGMNTIIFLDAHWWKNPLLGELELIKQSGVKPIVVIHDFKNPLHPEYEYDTYPEQNIVYEWDYVKNSVEQIYGNEYIRYYNENITESKRGCIFIIPIRNS